METTPASAPEMTCPKCGKAQPKQAQCRYCGVIVAKVKTPIAKPKPAPTPIDLSELDAAVEKPKKAEALKSPAAPAKKPLSLFNAGISFIVLGAGLAAWGFLNYFGVEKTDTAFQQQVVELWKTQGMLGVVVMVLGGCLCELRAIRRHLKAGGKFS